MIISRTPFRLSFFGGGTDYPAWYREHGGAVLGATIDKYCYLTCRYLPPFFEHRIRVVYSKIEMCETIDEIAHPAVREVLRFLDIERGVEIHHDGDLPARSGMGSSSAFTVGLLHALHALKGEMPTKRQLAAEGIHIEQEVLKEAVGSQDQVLAAHGGLNLVSFAPDGEVTVRPLTIGADRLAELNANLMLFYTGIARTASAIARSYVEDLDDGDQRFAAARALVDEGASALADPGQDIRRFGDLLHQAWLTKRSWSPLVSNSHVDEIYAAALEAGTIGGKLLGAGGGGFVLLFVPPGRQQAVRERLSDLVHVPFRFESEGSRIIFFDRDEDYAPEEWTRARRVPAASVRGATKDDG